MRGAREQKRIDETWRKGDALGPFGSGFGGLAFLINGHMAVSASSQGGLMLRVDPAQTDALIAEPGAEQFVMRGREMDGWLRSPPQPVVSQRDLEHWVRLGIAYARSLPPK